MFCLVVFLACALGSSVRPAPARSGSGTTSSIYPLRVGPTKRYLVDKQGRPFLIEGDSPQALLVNLTSTEARRYIADRKAAGFNSLWINLLCQTYTGGRRDGSTYDHVNPFRVRGDVSTPNEAYFSRVDAIIRFADEEGLTVFLDPAETAGWLPTLKANGVAKDYAYGRYVGKRYGRFPNIVWMSGNDFQQWPDASLDAYALAVARGIKSADPNHVQTLELNYVASASLDDPRWTSLLGLDAAYTYYPTYAEVLQEYDRSDHLPVFMVEANYEWEHAYTGPETLRRQEYWTLLSGAAGQFYGNKYTWGFIPGWKSHVDTVGTDQLRYVQRLFAGRDWYDLVPDQRHLLLVSGVGSFAATGSVNASDYATAARTEDGKLALAYLPTPRPVTIDLSRLVPGIHARWFDPSDGTFTADVTPLSRDGSFVTYDPPAVNHSGDGDWVLLLSAS